MIKLFNEWIKSAQKMIHKWCSRWSGAGTESTLMAVHQGNHNDDDDVDYNIYDDGDDNDDDDRNDDDN